MKLAKLIIKNFKCFDYKEVALGENTIISGPNGKGKTSILDAYSFLLTGKDSLLSADLDQFKPVRDDEVDKDAVVSVEGVIDGVSYIRTLSTPKKRDGSYKANTQTFEVDGIEVKKKEFDAKVQELYGGDVEVFKMLSDPNYVAEMHWTDRRKLILGENDSLEALQVDLEREKTSLKKAKGDTTDYNAKMEEVARQLEETPEVPDDIDEMILATEDALTESRSEKANLLAGDTSENVEKINRLNEALTTKLDEKRSIENKHTEASHEEYSRLSDLEFKVSAIQASDIAPLNNSIAMAKVKITEYGVTYRQHKDTVLSLDGNCSSCGQVLPNYDEVAETEKFNSSRSEKMEFCIKAANDLRAMITEHEQKIEEFEAQIKLIEVEAGASEHKNIHAMMNEVRNSQPVIPESLTREIAQIESDISRVSIENTTQKVDTSESDRVIEDLKQQLTELNSLKASQTTLESLTARMKELRGNKKDSGAVVATHEKKILDIDAKIQEEVKALEKEVNAQYDLVTWKLFDVQANGSIAPCCTPTVDGVEYAGLNRALKLNVGLSIINTIAKREGVSVVVWIDNAECCTDILETKSQSVRLYVKKDGALVIEGEK